MALRIEYPTYIVADIPSPMAEQIQVFRSRFDAERANMPAEVTLTGSCGVGTVSPGQEVDFVIREIDRIASQFDPFEAAFSHVERFNNTDIYFLTFQNPEPFLRLHQALAASSIVFVPSPFPYMPHCTLKLRKHPSEQELLELFFLDVPQEPFQIDMLSLYSLSDANSCELFHKAPLSKQS